MSDNKAWSGRFAEPVAELVKTYTASVGFDKRMAEFDIQGSLAHATMLARAGVLSDADLAAIRDGMEAILADIRAGRFDWSVDLEDVHMNVEKRLTDRIGDAGKRLHTGRSRNDQVATDIRLYMRDAIDRIVTHIRELQTSLLDLAEPNAATVMPGFTHLQVAQPVTLGHHLLAYVEMLQRDVSRFFAADERAGECPLGAAALAGTGFAIDREATAAALGFERPTGNSLDSVSDRDFALDYLASAAQCSLHLSRLAEELINWASPPFGFIQLSDQWSTGSSIMPQKRNPDAAELVRGHSGRIVGLFTGLMITMKGLPLAYSKDMQDDKAPTFEAHDLLALSLAALAGSVESATFKPARMREVAAQGFATATDLADWLVREAGIPFREAHHITGRAVARAEALGVRLDEVPLADLQAIDARIDERVYDVLSVDASVASRTSFGGTAPANGRAAIAAARESMQ